MEGREAGWGIGIPTATGPMASAVFRDVEAVISPYAPGAEGSEVLIRKVPQGTGFIGSSLAFEVQGSVDGVKILKVIGSVPIVRRGSVLLGASKRRICTGLVLRLWEILAIVLVVIVVKKESDVPNKEDVLGGVIGEEEVGQDVQVVTCRTPEVVRVGAVTGAMAFVRNFV